MLVLCHISDALVVCVAWFKVRDACECNDSLTLEPPDLDDKYLIFVLRAGGDI